LFLNCLLRDVQKVTANRGGISCHGKPKVVLGKSSSARIRICGPVGCRKTCGVWLRQSPRSSLRGEGVPGGKCSRARRLRRGGGKSTRIEHFGRAPCGAPVVLGHGARGGFPHRTEAHKCCRVNLSAYPAAAPTTFPARGPPCSRSSPTCFRERHNVKEKSDGFPAVQTAQLFASPTRPGKTCPPRNYPGGNHILPLSPFQVRICPV
jgi:hypothetical protein